MTCVLLDTHSLLWWWKGAPELSPRARAMIIDSGNRVLVSAASAWEIATKVRKGKLAGYEAVPANFLDYARRDKFDFLTIDVRHALRAGAYTMSHQDPFDRMLAAQSEHEQAILVTRDPEFAAFPCETVW